MASVTDTRMTVWRGATYRRRVVWPRPDAPNLYSAQLFLRRRLDDSTLLIPAVNITPAGSAGAVLTYIKLTPTQTLAFPVGKGFKAALVLTTIADPTENWIFPCDMDVLAVAAAVAP